MVELIPYLSEKFTNFTQAGQDYAATINKLKLAYDTKKNGAKEEEKGVLAVEMGNNFRQLPLYKRISLNPFRWPFWVSLSRPDMVKEVKIILH